MPLTKSPSEKTLSDNFQLKPFFVNCKFQNSFLTFNSDNDGINQCAKKKIFTPFNSDLEAIPNISQLPESDEDLIFLLKLIGGSKVFTKYPKNHHKPLIYDFLNIKRTQLCDMQISLINDNQSNLKSVYVDSIDQMDNFCENKLYGQTKASSWRNEFSFGFLNKESNRGIISSLKQEIV